MEHIVLLHPHVLPVRQCQLWFTDKPTEAHQVKKLHKLVLELSTGRVRMKPGLASLQNPYSVDHTTTPFSLGSVVSFANCISCDSYHSQEKKIPTILHPHRPFQKEFKIFIMLSIKTGGRKGVPAKGSEVPSESDQL